MQDVEAQQRGGTDGPAAYEGEAGIVTRMDESYVPEFYEPRHGALISRAGCGARHVRADRDRPDRELIPRQQISGERQEQRQDEEDDADVPVELAWRLVRAGHEDAEHVQPDGDDHRVRTPAMHLTHDPEGRLLAQVH